jgi:hypothetical protein
MACYSDSFTFFFYLVTTNNYAAFSSLHTLQITMAHIKSSQSIMSSVVVAWLWLLTVKIALLPCSWLTSDSDCRLVCPVGPHYVTLAWIT